MKVGQVVYHRVNCPWHGKLIIEIKNVDGVEHLRFDGNPIYYPSWKYKTN